MKSLGYLGPIGTYSHELATKYITNHPNKYQLVPFNSISEIIYAVHYATINFGIIPLENSIEGAVVQTLDTLCEDVDVFMIEELTMDIRECLLTKSNIASDTITTIYSHPQPLGQCRNYLHQNFPNIDTIAVGSTTQAIEKILRSNDPVAAIASPTAATIYSLNIVDNDIQDYKNNRTRFGLIQKSTLELNELQNKTSIAFSTFDKPGELLKVLTIFSIWDLNLMKIESRPSKNKLGEYLFFIDVASNTDKNNLLDALNMVRKKTTWFKILGSYNVTSL